MSPAIEFICRDCQANVIGIGYEAAPASGLCCICEWLSEFVPPEERAAVREFLASLEATAAGASSEAARWSFEHQARPGSLRSIT